MKVLGIETSCDETAAAVGAADRRILSNIVLSQLEAHEPYGGVVLEIAARAHVEAVDGVVAQAMSEAGITFSDLGGVAATGGPGLIGGVMVGVMTAKAIALAEAKPFVAVNHLEAHALTARLSSTEPGEVIAFPYLLLLVSGGHCQLLIVEGVGSYRRIGTTVDDALGEAFDKSAKLMGLGYPGGPILEKFAKKGDKKFFNLPKPIINKGGCNLSFAGLKTAILRLTKTIKSDQEKYDLAASFQKTIEEILYIKSKTAFDEFSKTNSIKDKTFVVYTDGVTEGYMKNGEELGAEGVQKIINEMSQVTPKSIVESIEKELNWGAEKLRDDITCMAINISNTELIKKK